MIDWQQAIDSYIDSIADNLLGIRRHLHSHPEPSREEFETTRFLSEHLSTAALPSKVLLGGRGIIAGNSSRQPARPWPSARIRTRSGFRIGKRSPTAQRGPA